MSVPKSYRSMEIRPDLMARREVEKKLKPKLVQHGCLLCSEHLPHHCHRRLVAEYLHAKWGGIETNHLV